jgi:hypothetical protein
MAKSNTKRNQQNSAAEQPPKKQKTAASITPPPEKAASEAKTLASLGLEQDDIDLAIDTLNTLAENPGVIKLKACKDLRTAVYEFRQACTTGMNASGPSLLLEGEVPRLMKRSRHEPYGSNQWGSCQWSLY